VRLVGVDPGRIDVVPLGLGARPVAPLSRDEAIARLGLDGRPYVFAPSLALPHKNLDRLVEALAQIPPERRPQLVLTAGGDDGSLRRRADQLGAGGDVRIVGWLDAPLLEAAYANAACMAFPSLVEGFGLPIMEAMLRRLPVACSDIAVLREVAGDCAVFFDPLDPASIARTLEELLADEGLRARLRDEGHGRAERFTWQATAEGTLRCYERTVGRPLRAMVAT
jgi:glycosyltransferase involved in cell wall biosynthesis